MDSFTFGFMFAFGVAVFALCVYVAYLIITFICTFLYWSVRKIVRSRKK